MLAVGSAEVRVEAETAEGSKQFLSFEHCRAILPLENECLTSHCAEWVGPQVVAGHSADWATP